MLKFKEYIIEQKSSIPTKIMSPLDLKSHIGDTKFKSIISHPIFKRHFSDKDTIGMTYDKTQSGLETVKVVHGNVSGLRKRADFLLSHSGRKIDKVDVYHNIDDEKHNGSLIWRHHNSYEK